MNALTVGIVAAAVCVRDLIKAVLAWRTATLKHQASERATRMKELKIP